ncbi:MAG: MFS transporter [Bryobacterales bacterium]|nr:MFS transporter [Bryobacterales bacterium]
MVPPPDAILYKIERRTERTLAVIFAGFSAFLTVYATQPILPVLRQALHIDAFLASLTVTASTLGMALTAPFAGRLSDRIGRKNTIVASGLSLAAATLACSQVDSLNALLFWRFLQGVFTPGIFAVTIAYIHDEWGAAEAGRGTASYVGGTVVGGFLGRFLSGLIAAHSDWHTVFLALGALNLASALLIWRFMPPETKKPAPPTAGFLPAVAEHFRNPLLLATFAVGFCVFFSLIATFTYINFYLAQPPFSLPTSVLGSLFFVYLTSTVVTPIAGRYIDRLGHRIVLVCGMAGGAAGALLTLVPNVIVIIIGLALVCNAVFVSQTCGNSFIGVATKTNRALAVGLYVMVYNIGGSMGAAVPGALWKGYGWSGVVTLIVAVQALTMLLAWNLWPARNR